MSTRRNFLGLGAVLSLNSLLLLSGCGSAGDANIPEERPATQEDYEKTKKAIEDGLKGMGKKRK